MSKIRFVKPEETKKLQEDWKDSSRNLTYSALVIFLLAVAAGVLHFIGLF